jgi:serine/threonine-protein kinase HipA
MVFSVLSSNLDDHLRNHGFLRLVTSSWALSPAFDLNPDPSPGAKYLTTAINETDTDASVELALDVAEMFRLDRSEAMAAMAEVAKAVSRWRDVATQLGQTKRQLDQMAPAFEHEQAVIAHRLS